MGNEDQPLRREPKTPSGGLDQGHADLLFEKPDLLRNRGCAVGECIGHSSKGLAVMQLPQNP